MVDYNSIIEGTVKFRDGKKWKSRWCVMRKLSPVADCLHLQLYRDSKDRYKQGQTKASLSLQHFLGVESGFTLDKESNTIAIICHDVTVILAFDTRERLIQWQVKISNNLGEDQQFLIQITSAPSKAKIATGPARMHVQDHRFSVTSGVPPRLMGSWEIAHLRRYGVVEGRFCFEGGSRCGKGEGLHVCVTDQGEEITQTIKTAAQGKLASRRRPVSRKMSAMDSPRKQLHSRADTRMSDVSCIDGFMTQQSVYADSVSRSVYASEATMNRSMCSDDGGYCTCGVEGSRHQSAEDLLCPCRHHRGRTSPFWPSDSTTGHHGNSELDSNYGCGDTTSVIDSHWPTGGDERERRPGFTAQDRCASCISKLGAPTMSRSSTATHANTPGVEFSPAWTMEPIPGGGRGSSCDRVSLGSSHGSSSTGNSEYSVPRFVEGCRHHPAPPNVPPKSPKSHAPLTLQTKSPAHGTCTCCPPTRPPKPASVTDSPLKKKPKKPPMPLPALAPVSPGPCTCRPQTRVEVNPMVGPYENYDVPKTLLGHPVKREDPLDSSHRLSLTTTDENYDTPRNVKECLAVSEFGNYDTPPRHAKPTDDDSATPRQPCGCVVKLGAVDDTAGRDCPCQRVMCWAENWMMLPYCRRGNGVENTAVTIHKVKLSGEGKMPVMNSSGEIAIYATIDKSKKSNRRSQPIPCSCSGNPDNAGQNKLDSNPRPHCEMNYANIEPDSQDPSNCQQADSNYQNIDFAHSLEYYENSRDVLQRAGISQQELESMADELAPVSYSVNNNGVKFCNKCGHSCHDKPPPNDPPDESKPITDTKQDDYLMMEPGRVAEVKSKYPGYIPMSPIAVTNKAASIPSLTAPHIDRSRKRSDIEFHRVPGSAMMMNHSPNSRYLRRLMIDGDETRVGRKRSSSADSSWYLDDDDERKIEVEVRRESVGAVDAAGLSLECSRETITQEVNKEDSREAEEGRDNASISSDSLRTLIHECLVEQPAPASVHIRRSSSVPCKSGNNRDSSSSNDSGVSTGSLKHRGADFAEFELPLTTSMSSRRHYQTTRHPMVVNCLHSSLPRRSKSVDPLRELTFQFQRIKVPAKSSSAEAEVPVCLNKREPAKGFASTGVDGATVAPYMDSRSTSSGTSDMSDYIETLSLSSHSSSDTPDSLRLMRPATTTLRPRSGKEYQLIDRSILETDAVKYANIAPVPEKSESPSPGYMSSSPGQEREDQPLLPAHSFTQQ